MRFTCILLLAAAALLQPTSAALANERGLVIRAGDLYAEPFIDAAKLGPLTPNQPVTIVARRGGWVSVEVGGKRGWVRMLNIRLEPVARPAGRPLAGMRTGSTGRTVATGVKGLDEADIRAASIDHAQLAKLQQMGATDADAQQYATTQKLKETKVAALKPGRVP